MGKTESFHRLALLLFVLCSSLTALGQKTLVITLSSSTSNGNFQNPNSDGTLYSKWVSNTNPVITISTASGTHDLKKTDDGTLRLAPGRNNSSSYILSLSEGSEGYVIKSLTFTATAVGADMTLSDGKQSKKFTVGSAYQEFTMSDNGASSLTFTVSGNNKSDGSNHLAISKLVVTVEQLCHVTYHLKSKQTNYEYTWQDYERVGQSLTQAVPADKQRAFCSYAFYSDKKLSTPATTVTGPVTQDVYVNYTVDADALKSTLGWTYSTADAPTWYYLNFNSYNGTTRSKYYLNDSGTALTTSQPISDGYLWAFVGDPYGTRLINKKQGTTKWLVSNTPPSSITAHNQSGTLSLNSDDTNGHWELLQFTANDGDKLPGDFALRLQGAGITTFMALSKGKLGFYANKDYDGKYQAGGTATFDATASLSATTPVQLTFEVYRSDDDKVASKENVYACPGFPPYLPTELRRGFCQYSYDTDTVTTATTLVKANYLVIGLPFTPSDDKSHLLYYTMAVGTTSRQAFYDSKSGKLGTDSKRTSKNDEDCWGFIGDPYGLTIYNRATGDTRPLGVLAANLNSLTENVSDTYGPTLSSDATNNSVWELFDPNNTSGKDLCLRLKGTHVYMSLNGFVDLRRFSETTENGFMNTEAKITNTQGTGNGTIVFYVRDSVAVNVNFHVCTESAKEHYNVKANTTLGAAPYIPASALRAFLTVSGYYTDATLTTALPTVTANIKDIYVKVSEGDLPFTVSDPDKDEWHWYYMRIRNGSQYVSAFGPGPYQATGDNPYEPQSLWAFAGSVADGFVIYNRWFGKKYILTNINKDIYASGAVDANHERYMGPVLQYKTETVADTAKWYLVNGGTDNGQTMFGFTNKAYPNMSINVHTRYHDVGFYYWDATKAINSRLKVEAYQAKSSSSETQSAALTTLRSRIATLRAHKGGVFSFKNDKDIDISENSTVSAATLEEFITNPDNYVRPESVPYTRIQSVGGKYLKVAPATFVITARADVSTAPLLADYSSSDAGLVFHLNFDKDNDNYEWTSQGIYMQPVTADTTSTWTSGSTKPSQNVYVYSKGAGMACIVVTPLTQYPYMHVMKTTRDGSAVTGGAFNQGASSWYVIPATSVEAKAAKISNDGDAYQGQSLASLCYDFPVQATGDGLAYYCSKRSDDAITFTQATDNKIPAGVPFIYINPKGETAPKLTILSKDITGLTPIPDFRGILLNTQYDESDFRYASTLAFGYKSNTSYWLSTTDGKKTGAAFRKPSNTSTFGPNKGCIYLSTAAAKPAMRILFAETATGIREITTRPEDNDSYYDLQGRRIEKPSHGIYIHKGKKVIIL